MTSVYTGAARALLIASILALSAACSGSEGPSDPADAGLSDASDAGPRLPPVTPNEAGWWRGAVGYQVFVRSFMDSDADGIGDLPGLVDRLDYLNDGDPSTSDDLGVDALWLMPIHPSPSYHGYDITDYRDVRAEYGGLAAFDALVEQAHLRGMRVVLDFVLNHSSREHPWFVSAQQGPQADFRDYYTWSDTDPGWTRPWDRQQVWFELEGSYYYALFGEPIPDLDLSNPAVEDEIFETMRFWAARGVDGFRVDAARHLFESEDGDVSDQPETHAFVQRLRARLHAEHPQVLLLAEAWIGVETLKDYYGEGYEYQLAFSFDLAAAVKDAVRDGATDSLRSVLERSARAFEDRGFEAPFLANHDQDRALRSMGRGADQARLGAATLMALPGTPWVYYGEELGYLGGDTPFDEDKRQPMRWTSEAPGYGFTAADDTWHRSTEAAGVDVAAQRGVDGSLWSLYRDLVTLRHDHPALGDGDQVLLETEGAVVAWTRTKGEATVLFVANYGDAATGPLTVPAAGAPTALLAEGAGAVTGGEAVQLADLGPRGFAFIALE